MSTIKTHSQTKTGGVEVFSKIPTETTGRSLYIHVPFCAKKCPYCHFYVTRTKEEQVALYMEALYKEIASHQSYLDRPLTSIYFGGGTPSQLDPTLICDILSRLPRTGATEVTVEVNPEDATPEYFQTLRRGGVNRVSFGVQSLCNTHLKQLGRGHTAQQAIRAIEMASACGIGNITIDLMYEIPHQTLQTWENTLTALDQLPITHLSLYNLTFEESTPFYRKRIALLPTIPDSETGAKMLEMAIDHLETIGLPRYEISAFGTPSVHNVGYWSYRDTLGLGPSAFTYIQGHRTQNHPNLRKWASAIASKRVPVAFEERLESEAALREQIAVGLRLLGGVEIGALPASIAKDLQDLMRKGLVQTLNGRTSLTPRGLLFYEDVASTIV